MPASHPEAGTFLVACLCAAWCRTCDDYRIVFDALALDHQGSARFVWVDIEDEEEALGNVDVLDFPTLMIARGDALVFFGPVLPHPQTARLLVHRALLGELGEQSDPALAGLPERIARLR